MIDYIVDLCEDIPEEDFNSQIIVDSITPAWVLGHLTYELTQTANNLSIELKIDDHWPSCFCQGSSPTDIPSLVKKNQLINLFKECYEGFIISLPTVSLGVLEEDNPTKILGDYYPKLKNDVTHMLTVHLGIHGGQIGMWRKVYGLSNKYGK